jgi:hypothetical protein
MKRIRGIGSIGVLVAVAAFAFVFAACDDKKEEAPAVPTVTQPASDGEPSPTAVTGEEFPLPDSPIEASLDRPYAYNAAGSLTPVEAQYPFPAGSVAARWYQSEGLYVIYFEGFPIGAALCPGASIFADAGYQNAANSPTAPGACADADTLKPPPTGPYVCGDGLLLFLTEVPTSSVGELYASTNLFHEDGSATGLLGSTPSDIAQTPEVDLSSCTPPTG